MSRKIIIAFSGFKQSGKTTSVELLENILTGDFKYGSQIGSVTVESFADPVKRIVEDIFGVKEIDIEDKEALISSTKKFFKNAMSYRDMCIAVGDGMKASLRCPNLWCNTIERHIRSKFAEKNPLDKVFIIPDVRYGAELHMLERMKKAGYEVYHVCVFRKEALPDWVYTGLNICDKTERNIILDNFKTTRSEYEWCAANPKFNAYLTNDGSVYELEEQIRSKIVEKIWK